MLAMRLTAALLLLGAAAAAAAAAAPVDAETRAADEARVGAAFEALASGDAGAFAALFARNGVFVFDGNATVSRGRGAIAAAWQPVLKQSLAVRGEIQSELFYPEAERAGERVVRFVASYAHLGRVPKKRSQRCNAVADAHAYEEVVFGADDGLVRRWRSLPSTSPEDVRRQIKCLGHADPEEAEKNVPCYDVTDVTWGLLSAQRAMETEHADHYFSDEAVITFEDRVLDGPEGAASLFRSWFDDLGAVQSESHFNYGPFCPETDLNVNALLRTLAVVTADGCSAAVRSLERLELDNDRKVVRWDVTWDRPLAGVRDALKACAAARAEPKAHSEL